jgi:hypothetical protein
LSDIKDIEGIIKSDQQRLEKLEVEYKEKSERVLKEANELIQNSSVLKRLSDINEHINNKVNEDTDWKSKPFVGDWSYRVWPDTFKTFKHLKEIDIEKKKKGEISNTYINATFEYVFQTERSFWRRSKVAYKVDIAVSLYDELSKNYWAFNFGNRRGGLTEREFWEEFKKEIADRWK